MHRRGAAAAGAAAGAEDEDDAVAAGSGASAPGDDEAVPSDDEAVDASPADHDDPASDSSEDERPNRNTVGDVPLEWYRAEEHIGYDKEGDRIIKKERKDKLDLMLERNDSAKASAASCIASGGGRAPGVQAPCAPAQGLGGAAVPGLETTTALLPSPIHPCSS